MMKNLLFIVGLAACISSTAVADDKVYRVPEAGVEIHNPHSLEKLDLANYNGKKESRNDSSAKGTSKSLIIFKFSKGDDAIGAISVKYSKTFDRKKPLRYHLGKLVRSIKQKDVHNIELESSYENTLIGGRKALYYKAVPSIDSTMDLGVKTEAHLYAFNHNNTIFYIQSGINVSDKLPVDEINAIFNEFEGIVKDTVNAIILKDVLH